MTHIVFSKMCLVQLMFQLVIYAFPGEVSPQIHLGQDILRESNILR